LGPGGPFAGGGLLNGSPAGGGNPSDSPTTSGQRGPARAAGRGVLRAQHWAGTSGAVDGEISVTILEPANPAGLPGRREAWTPRSGAAFVFFRPAKRPGDTRAVGTKEKKKGARGGGGTFRFHVLEGAGADSARDLRRATAPLLAPRGDGGLGPASGARWYSGGHRLSLLRGGGRNSRRPPQIRQAKATGPFLANPLVFKVARRAPWAGAGPRAALFYRAPLGSGPGGDAKKRNQSVGWAQGAERVGN